MIVRFYLDKICYRILIGLVHLVQYSELFIKKIFLCKSCCFNYLGCNCFNMLIFFVDYDRLQDMILRLIQWLLNFLILRLSIIIGFEGFIN